MTSAETSHRPTLIRTLPGRAYTDPEFFEREQRQVLGTAWLCVEQARMIAEPGQYRTVTIAGENVLLLRGLDGTVRAFLNSCRHRGTLLCEDESGQVKRSLRCPYHAWTYDLEGRLVGAPNLRQMPDIDFDQLALVAVHVREWLGFVWICLAEQPPSFEQTVIAGVDQRFGEGVVDRYELDRLEVGRRLTYEVRANWKLIIENFYECYHCATIHPELVEVLPEFRRGLATQQHDEPHGAEFAETVRGFTIDGGEGFDPLPALTEDLDRKYYGYTVPPQTILNMVPDHVIFHRLFPMAPDLTIVECDWLFDPAVVRSGADLTRSVELFNTVNKQDFAACERCQRGMGSRAYRDGGVFVPVEHHIVDFHEWVTDRTGPVSPV